MDGEIPSKNESPDVAFAKKKLAELRKALEKQPMEKAPPGVAGEHMADAAYYGAIIDNAKAQETEAIIKGKPIESLSREDIYFILHHHGSECREAYTKYNTVRQEKNLPPVGYYMMTHDGTIFLGSPYDNVNGARVGIIRVPIGKTGTIADEKGNIVAIPSIDDLREIIKLRKK